MVDPTTTRRTATPSAATWRPRSPRLIASASVLVELVVQGLEADAQDDSRAGLVAAGLLEGFQDQLPLRVLDCGANRQHHLGFGPRRGGQGPLVEGGQVLGPDELVWADDHGALDHV